MRGRRLVAASYSIAKQLLLEVGLRTEGTFLMRIVNANRLQIHALAYNIFNWFRRLVLSANMRKQRIDTVLLKLLKIAAKIIRSARYMTFKLRSSCPNKDEFYKTLFNISKLCIQLE